MVVCDIVDHTTQSPLQRRKDQHPVMMHISLVQNMSTYPNAADLVELHAIFNLLEDLNICNGDVSCLSQNQPKQVTKLAVTCVCTSTWARRESSENR